MSDKNKITEDFTEDDLLDLTIAQLKEVFKWYGLTYPYKGKKADIIAELFVDPEPEIEEPPMSVRIRRIRNASK